MPAKACASGWIDDPPIGYINAGIYGAAGNGVTDDASAIQAAINDAALTVNSGVGNTVWLRQGTYLLGSQLVIKNKVRLVGVGRSGTVLKAASGVAPATGLVRLGDGTGTVFGCRLENLTVDCNDVASSTGVYTSEGQEQSGLLLCVVKGFTTNGVVFDSGSQHTVMDVCEVYGSGMSAPTNGVFVQNAGGTAYISRCTISGTGTATMANSINVTGSRCYIEGIHVETCTDGIDISGANSAGTIINGISGHSTVTNVVNLSTTADITILGVIRNGATNGYSGSTLGTFAGDSPILSQSTSRSFFRVGASSNSGLDITNSANRALVAGDAVVRLRSGNTTDIGSILRIARTATDSVAQVYLDSAGDDPSTATAGGIWRNGDKIRFQGSRLFSMIGGYDGAFTVTAAGVTTISDTNVTTGSRVVIFPTNTAAGLLTRSKSCWVDTISAGSFVFNVSSTGAGAPAGTETFSYHVT